MKRPRLLITGINYAPEQTGIAVQTTGLAEGLAERGWEVTVLTGIPHYPAWRPGPVPPPTLADPVRVIRRTHFVPRRQSLGLRAAYECSWVASSVPTLIKRCEADVILGITPSLGGAACAALGAARSRVPYALLFQDLMGRAARQSRFKHAGSVAASVEAAELFLARHAAGVGVIAEGFRSYLVARGVSANRIHLVRNPVRLRDPSREREEVRERLGWLDDDFVVLHAGNMGLKQGLENVVRAAKEASPEERIRFVLQGDGNQRSYLERLAADLDVRNLTFSPLVPADELPDVLAAADVLLLNQRRDVRDMSLPGKLTSYFAIGRPVVAAVAVDSEAGREIMASRGGIVIDPEQPEVLLGTVRELATQPRLRSQLGSDGRAFAERNLRPEATLHQIETLLNSALSAQISRAPRTQRKERTAD